MKEDNLKANEKIIEKLKVKPSTSTIIGFISNIPFIPFNPASMIMAGKVIRDFYKIDKECSLDFFMMELRKIIKKLVPYNG